MAKELSEEQELLNAAKNNDPKAQFELGCYYEDREEFGEAKKYYEQAAGKKYAPALHNLACLYEREQGVKKNISKAVSLYRSAIEEDAYTPSLLNLARLYMLGDDDLKQDNDEAFNLATQAAESGDEDSLIFLGNLYENGIGTEKNDDVALYWYNKAKDGGSDAADAYINSLNSRIASAASGELPDWMSGYIASAESGDAASMYAIGYMYYLGQAIPLDYQKAIEWFEKAAAINYDYAFYFLGECYKNGQGVAADPNKAKEYYRRAADMGNEAAKAALKNM